MTVQVIIDWWTQTMNIRYAAVIDISTEWEYFGFFFFSAFPRASRVDQLFSSYDRFFDVIVRKTDWLIRTQKPATRFIKRSQSVISLWRWSEIFLPNNRAIFDTLSFWSAAKDVSLFAIPFHDSSCVCCIVGAGLCASLSRLYYY